MPVIASRLGSAQVSAAALIGAGDPASSRLVYSMVIGLVVIGLLLIVLGIWIIRQTRVDLDVLAPLERMGDGEWKKRDRSTQRRMLDEVRPDGAQPLTPAKQAPTIDAEFELDEHPVTSFSDLGPGVPSDKSDPTSVGDDADSVAERDVEPEVEAEVEPEPDSTPVSGPGPVLLASFDDMSGAVSDVEVVDEPDGESATDSRT